MVRFSDDGRHFFQEVTVPVRFVVRVGLSHYERTRAMVYATGNKWAIENFNATH